MAAATAAAFACFLTGEIGGDGPLRAEAVDDAYVEVEDNDGSADVRREQVV